MTRLGVDFAQAKRHHTTIAFFSFNKSLLIIPEIQELTTAVKATEDWIDDLQRRLCCHDRERVYNALLATLHAL